MREYKKYLEEFCKRVSNITFDRMHTLSFFMGEKSR